MKSMEEEEIRGREEGAIDRSKRRKKNEEKEEKKRRRRERKCSRNLKAKFSKKKRNPREKTVSGFCVFMVLV